MLALLLAALVLEAGPADVVRAVRGDLARRDLAAAERRVAAYRAQQGATPEAIEALSWLARGALEAGKIDAAERYSAETRKLVDEALRRRPLDADRRLPTALGAAIEVHAKALAQQERRAEAVSFLREEMRRWGASSIGPRIQKNLNLLTLEGQPAPPLEVKEWIGARPQSLAALKGRVALLFFWAHWCGDCKAMAPALARLEREYGARGFAIVGPTQLYGYVARGEEAAPERERAYIQQVRRASYGGVESMTVPVSEANFRRYGASTTPTLVLVDRKGIVRMYHPGSMSYEELAARVNAALGSR
jgi:thiol-disulfide isomerase/thioredoxin